MRIGIRLGTGKDPAKAARDAVRQAMKAVPRPSLALVFAGVKLDQKKVHAALCRVLDPAILVGGSSYAEITPAGVSKNSVAVLLLDYPQAGFAFAGSCIGKDPAGAGERMADALGPPPDRCQLGLVISGVSDGRDDRCNQLTASVIERSEGGLVIGCHQCAKPWIQSKKERLDDA